MRKLLSELRLYLFWFPGRTLGQGAYGEVVEAMWTRKGSLSPSFNQGDTTTAASSACSPASEHVAVKKIMAMKDSNCQIDFLSEVRALFNIHHPGIVKLIGISFGPPVMLVSSLTASNLNDTLFFSDF